jgi:hypothetical protein
MERLGESGEMSLRYPVYAVLAAEAGGDESLVVVELDGNDCLLLYRTRELAELYLEQADATDDGGPLTLRPCAGDTELEHLLAQLPPSVSQVLWDATPRARALRLTPVRDLLEVLRGGLEGSL